MQSNRERKFNALIFDLGNTLMYFNGNFPEVLDEAEAALIRFIIDTGIELNEITAKDLLHQRIITYYKTREDDCVESSTYSVLRTLIQDIGYGDLSDQVLRKALGEFYRVTQDYWHIEQDTISTLKTLKLNDYKIGMISNAGDDDDVQALVDKAGIRNYFDLILTSASVGFRKPDPRIFKKLLDSMKITAINTLMVGDSLNADIMGAQNSGIYSVWITRRVDNPENARKKDKIKPDAAISSLEELPSLLEQLNL